MAGNWHPGPWHVASGRGGARVCAGPLFLAGVVEQPLVEDREATAQLIAAAPDLYDALADMTAICATTAPDHNLAIKRARAALAKATGTRIDPVSENETPTTQTTGA